MQPSFPSIQQLRRALEIAEQIQRLEEELAAVLRDQPKSQAPVTAPTQGKKGTMSVAARARIAAAQRARWAKQKGAPTEGNGASKRKKRRKMTAEGRARIAEAARKRWAAVKAAK